MTDNRTKFNTEAKPTWCPGCGNFGIQQALKMTFNEMNLASHEVAICSGIGCCGKIPYWINVCGLHGLHGRSLPLAEGTKLANRKLVVIAEGGDGDGYSEGGNHFIHACRRNIDIAYIVHDNGVYGLTTGQVSPTGELGMKTGTTPFGSIEPPFSPLALAIAAEAGFVARGYSGDMEHLSGLMRQAIEYKGFAFLDVLQVCVSFHPSKGYKWYKDRVYKVEETAHDPTDRDMAMILAMKAQNAEKLPIGVIYKKERPTFEEQTPPLAGEPLVERPTGGLDITPLMEELV